MGYDAPMLAAGTALFLVLLRNPGARSRLLADPGLLDGESARLWLTFGLWPLILAALFWAAAWGAGRRALKPVSKLDEVVAAAFGLGLLGFSMIVLGLSAGLGPAPLLVFAAAAAAFGWTALPRPRVPNPPALLLPESLALGAFLFGVFHLVIVSLAPPSEWDVRAYHLALPELYLARGGVGRIPWLLHSHWPHAMEALYALPLALGRDGAAALIHAGACALLVLGVFRAATGKTAAWTGALILAGQPALLRGAPTAHADGACALLLFAAAAALARWEEKRGEPRLVAAGLLAGFAVSAKLFGAAGAASWTLWLLWRGRAKAAAIFAGCAALAAGPWLLKTFAETGDPFWPLLGRTLESAALAARYKASNLWSWPPPPWLLTHYAPPLLLVPLGGLLALGRGRKPASGTERFLWMSVPALALLALRHHEAWRFMIPGYAAAALAAGRGAAAAFAAGGGRRLAAAGLVVLAASPLLGLTQNNELFPVLGVRPAAGGDRRAAFEERAVEPAGFYREARALLPADAKVLLFREIRGYRAGFDYVWGDPLNQAELDWRRLETPEAAYARLKEMGVTHLLEHPGSRLYGEDPLYYDARTLALFSALAKSRARPVLVRPGFVLHQLL